MNDNMNNNGIPSNIQDSDDTQDHINNNDNHKDIEYVSIPRRSIRWFAGHMESKLERDDAEKGDWTECGPVTLLDELHEELFELNMALCKYSSEQTERTAHDIISECADVANFAMMIATLYNDKMRELNRGRAK